MKAIMHFKLGFIANLGSETEQTKQIYEASKQLIENMKLKTRLDNFKKIFFQMIPTFM